MTRMNEKSEKEIDDIVISQADDPDAWEEEAHVIPRPWRSNAPRLELAAKFFVLSALHRLGARPTLMSGHDQGADITLVDASGAVTFVQIKTLADDYRWRVQEIDARKNHYIVFVCFTNEIRNPHVPPEVFILSSQVLRSSLATQSESEIRIDTLGTQLEAREAWQRLVPPLTAA